jgi:hypothetical protein
MGNDAAAGRIGAVLLLLFLLSRLFGSLMMTVVLFSFAKKLSWLWMVIPSLPPSLSSSGRAAQRLHATHTHTTID